MPLLLAYHHDYNCLSERLFKLASLTVVERTEAQRRLERFEAVKREAARFYL